MPQNIDPTKRSRATQSDILVAFRDRLRAACPGCNDLTCFVSDQPVPVAVPGGGHCVTIAPGEGSFDQRLFAGGGHTTLNEDAMVVITPMVKIQLDRIPQAERALLASDRGVLSVWKRNILRSLFVFEPAAGVNSHAWEPAIGDRPLCREQIRPLSVSAPADIPGHAGWIGFHLTLGVSYDWDLYDA